jgi:hypothetical protein
MFLARMDEVGRACKAIEYLIRGTHRQQMNEVHLLQSLEEEGYAKADIKASIRELRADGVIRFDRTDNMYILCRDA